MALTVCWAVASAWNMAHADPAQVWSVYTAADGLASNAILALAVAPEGCLWAGTTRGLSRFDGHRWTALDTSQSLGEEWVTSLVVDGRGTVWCGTYGSGLGVWDGQRWRTFTCEDSGLASDWITALALGSGGQLWIGTLGGGVQRFDGQSWTTYTGANSCLPMDSISALAADAEGTLWVGTSGGGVCRLAAEDCWCYRTTDSSLANDYITALALGADGRLWIGTEEGLSALDTADGVWWRWGKGSGLPDVRISALLWDKQHRLWVGTGKGLALREGQTWARYTRQAGLGHNVISALAADADGNIWVGTLGGGVNRLGQVKKALPSPRPVVLVHGWRGPESDRIEDSEFKFLRRWLEQDGHPVFYATGIHPANTLHENARQLRKSIARAKAATGASQVDIIAFSMGGLNARAYIESVLYANDVHACLILGTPHAGVHLWKTFLLHEIAHWSDEPSARELLPEHVAWFNRTHHNGWDVPYLLGAGVAKAEELPPLFEFLAPSDGLISAWSAHALEGPAVRYITTDDLHAWSDETILLEIPSFFWPNDTYRLHLRPALRDEEGTEESRNRPAWQSLPAEAHSPLFSGEIAAGQVVTHVLHLDATGTNRFYARWQEGELTFRLRDPTGKSIDPESAEDADDVAYFALPFANFASYVITDTLTGAWICHLEAPETLPQPAGYALYAVLDSSLRMRVGVEREVYCRGELAVLTATLTQEGKPLPGADVSAAIYLPDHKAIALTLYDDGQHGDSAAEDGVYGNKWTVIGPGGYYPLFISARGASGGSRFERGAEGVLVVSPETATLTGYLQEEARDGDGDGLYETLAVEVGVEVVRGGDFLLSGQLLTQEGERVASVTLPLRLERGRHTITLSFAGGMIRRHRRSGPYRIAGLSLMDISGAAVPLDQGPTLSTRNYLWHAFGP